MQQVSLDQFPHCTFGKNVSIKGEDVVISSGAVIGDNVSIEAGRVRIGHDSVIEYGTKIKGLGKPMELFEMGDNALIAFNNQILTTHFSIGDYSQLHNTGLHSGYKPLTIGHNCWIGQNTILNCTERLEIHNNVRIGTQSQLWTHVASGELLEGCTLYGNNPLVLKDNVWIVGGAVISPGLVLEKSSIIMTGSVLTKSTEPYHTYAGVPAKDVTDKLNFWSNPTAEEKFSMLKKFIKEFIEQKPEYESKVHIYEMHTRDNTGVENEENLVFFADAGDMSLMAGQKASVFDLKTKTYTKRRSRAEIDWIRFGVGFRARFIPYNNKRQE